MPVGACSQATLRGCGGVPALVTAIAQGPGSESTHRALLALRVLSDRDADREAILLAGGVPCLAALLNVGPDSEVTQCALAALGNLAAGGQLLKDAIREVCVIVQEALVFATYTGAIVLPEDISQAIATLAGWVSSDPAAQAIASSESIYEHGEIPGCVRVQQKGAWHNWQQL